MGASLKNLWDVFLLFLIPIGGGIPGGVVLAQSRAIAWPIMMMLYFLSDIVLACTFEPIMHYCIRKGKTNPALFKFGQLMKAMIDKTLEHYGNSSNILVLIMIAFGVDPMTGRGVALVKGHGFFTGWAIAIAGDMIYFTLIMVSTIWLNNILGDGTLTVIIIVVLMILMPKAIQYLKDRFSKIKN